MTGRQECIRFEMPFKIAAPLLTDEGLGIDKVMLLNDPTGETQRITLLDTADERLLRAGVILAHRVKSGEGEWYLHAPGWQPWLPVDKAIPLDSVGLPDEYAELIRPFRRRSALEPIVSVTRHTGCYAFVDVDGNQIGELEDARVTLRRGPLAVGRFREARFKPGTMTAEQRGYVVEQLLAIGGMRVEKFPNVFARLGGPRIGMTDLPHPHDVAKGASLETLVTSVFATGLRKVVLADLAVRAGHVPDTSGLRNELDDVLADVRGLEGLIDPAWAERLGTDLVDLVAMPVADSLNALGDRYLEVLDRLVSAARAPRLGSNGTSSAKGILRTRLRNTLAELREQCGDLSVDSLNEDWQAALIKAQQTLGQARLARGFFAKGVVRLKPLRKIVALLVAAQSSEAPSPDLDGLDAEDAFQAGRSWQREFAAIDAARAEFVREWRRLSRLLPKRKQSDD